MDARCPHCKQILEAPEDMAGQVAACPDCGADIRLPAAITPSSTREASQEAPSPQSGVSKTEDKPKAQPVLQKCPQCGEDILASARKCKHCGSDLSALNQLANGMFGCGCLLLLIGVVGVIIFGVLIMLSTGG
jgi:DNA-directed RNA polymerase subunit M/transcription elongation factor TFIIS